MNEFHFTITSRDHNDYATIRTNLKTPSTELTEVMITNLTTTCSLEILNNDDYIEFKVRTVNYKIFMRQFLSMNAEKLLAFLNEQTMDVLTFAYGYYGERIEITSTSTEDFTIVDMTHNLKLLTGFYHHSFPIKSSNECILTLELIDWTKHKVELVEGDTIMFGGSGRYLQKNYTINKLSDITQIMDLLLVKGISFHHIQDKNIVILFSSTPFEITEASENILKFFGISQPLPVKSFNNPHIIAPSVGYFQSTPILYLTSNLGTTHYSYVDNDCTNQKILMKINNYFIHGFPIVCHNFEYSSIVITSALSEACFKLVDANFKPVKLLSPMYLSITATSVPSGQAEHQNRH